MHCRHCAAPLEQTFIDLGYAPPSNAYLSKNDLSKPEVHYPLRVKVCHVCWLVQTEDFAGAETFFDAHYAYFSSTSSSWLAHAARYVDMIVARLGLNANSFVLEVASNDGYLLKNFLAKGIPCLGFEPTASTAAAAEALGLRVRREFFGERTARAVADHRRADLIIGNNVYAHVPDINDFTNGLSAALAPNGTITLEFPHLLRLIDENQFDTIYHEHFSYFSLTVVSRIFAASGLRVWDVEEIPTHGGSLRVYGCHANDARPRESRVDSMIAEEVRRGFEMSEVYEGFQARAEHSKDELLTFLLESKRQGISVAAYGAAAKGNTLLNFSGVRPDLVPYICDAAPSKQGHYMPGSHIPILPPHELLTRKPESVLVLPWNIAAEVAKQNESLRAHGVRFYTAIPRLRELP